MPAALTSAIRIALKPMPKTALCRVGCTTGMAAPARPTLQIACPHTARAASAAWNVLRPTNLTASIPVAILPVKTPPALTFQSATSSSAHAASTERIAGKPIKTTAGGLVVSLPVQTPPALISLGAWNITALAALANPASTRSRKATAKAVAASSGLTPVSSWMMLKSVLPALAPAASANRNASWSPSQRVRQHGG